jgi:hypothetical protein
MVCMRLCSMFYMCRGEHYACSLVYLWAHGICVRWLWNYCPVSHHYHIRNSILIELSMKRYAFPQTHLCRCTHLGGALFLAQIFIVWNIWSLLQILVLSSNTKKGEIESAYLVSLVFCVLDNNIRNFKCVLSGADFTAQDLAMSLSLFQAG